MTTADPFAGMTPEDTARAQAAAANARSIQAKREAAARLLLAPPGPAKAVKAAWEPVRQALDAQKSIAGPEAQANAERPGGGDCGPVRR